MVSVHLPQKKCRFCYNIIQQAITTTIQKPLGNTRMQIPKHHNVNNKECLGERIVEPEASQCD